MLWGYISAGMGGEESEDKAMESWDAMAPGKTVLDG